MNFDLADRNFVLIRMAWGDVDAAAAGVATEFISTSRSSSSEGNNDDAKPPQGHCISPTLGYDGDCTPNLCLDVGSGVNR